MSPSNTELSDQGSPANSEPVRKKKRNAFDAKTKLEVVEFAETTSNHKAAKAYKIDRKQVREWRKIKSELTALV